MRPRISWMLLGVLFGTGFWILDSLVDSLLFASASLKDSLILNVPAHDVHTRLIVLAGFVTFAGLMSIQRGRNARLIEDLTDSRERFHTLFDDSPLPTWEDDWSDVKGYFDELRAKGVVDFAAHFDEHPEDVDLCISRIRVVAANQAAVRLHEAENKKTLIDRFFETLNEKTRETYQDELVAFAEGEKEFRAETVHVTHSGRTIDVDLTAHIARGHEKDLRRVFISTLPITERKEAERQLHHLARHDSLTGVYNRHTLRELLTQEEARARRYGHPIGLIMVDVNRFKEINDRFGHQMGDRIPVSVSRLLTEVVRTSDFVVRYGGDEFLIVLPETNGETETVRARIQEVVSQRNKTNEMVDFPVTLAVGTAHWDPTGDLKVEDLLAAADQRMYQDKRARAVAQ